MQQIVKVRYFDEQIGKFYSREYSYLSADTLKVGDIVIVPVRDTIGKAQVSVVDIPESQVAAFRDKLKTIPAGAKVVENPCLDIQPKEQSPDPETAGKMEDYIGKVVKQPRNKIMDEYYQETGIESLPKDTTPNGNFAEQQPEQQPKQQSENTAVIIIHPESNLAVTKLKIEITKLKEYAEARTITRDEDATPATNDIIFIANLKKALKTQKDNYVKPVKSHLNNITAVFKELEDLLEQADLINRGKLSAYREAQKALADKAAEINRQAEDLARKQAEFSGTGEFTVNTTPVEAPPVINKVRSAMGTSSFRDNWTWEMEDRSLIPSDYMIIDAAKITKEVKAGVRKIPGIKIFNKETLQARAS